MSAYTKLLRPEQWVKNSFLLLPLIFCGALRSEHWRESIALCLIGIACFCCWSSCAYIVNDIFDRNRDRLHPRKRFRPIASGAVSIRQATFAAVALAFAPLAFLGTAAALTGDAFSLNRDGFWFLAIGGLYLVNNLLYNLIFRSFIILDVISIAVGFLFRLLGGCFILNVQPSVWLLVCGFSLAVELGFSKRWLELARLNENGEEYRNSLSGYSKRLLRWGLGVSTAVTLTAYVLYTIAPATIAVHRTDKLIYTCPFVFFGVFRYLSDVFQEKADGPVEIVLHDRLFLINGAVWIAFALCLILN